MDSNTLFMQAAENSCKITLLIELALVILFASCNWKYRKEIKCWLRGGTFIFGSNVLIFFVIFLFVFFRPIKVKEKVVTLDPEVIVQTNIIEQENVIDVPSIMLPLEPEGNQAIIIDTTSDMERFMQEFYGENVYFFNNRQDATYLIKEDELVNYSGLDISKIKYDESNKINTMRLDDINYETVWIFSNLSNIDIISSNTKVMLYVPRQLTDEEVQNLKQKNSDITIITIEQIC